MSEPQKISSVLETQQFPIPRKPILADSKETGDGLFYFHLPGDYLKGFLIGMQARESLHYIQKTYIMRALEGRQDGVDLDLGKDGQIIEFPANLRARRIIEDNELLDSLVRIVFRGKRGRYKNYDVFKDTGTFYSKELQYGPKRKRRKKRSAAGRKSDRKPGRVRA